MDLRFCCFHFGSAVVGCCRWSWTRTLTSKWAHVWSVNNEPATKTKTKTWKLFSFHFSVKITCKTVCSLRKQWNLSDHFTAHSSWFDEPVTVNHINSDWPHFRILLKIFSAIKWKSGFIQIVFCLENFIKNFARLREILKNQFFILCGNSILMSGERAHMA